MKQRKLRSYVMPTLYVLILMFIFGTVSLISTLMNTDPNYLYSIGILTGGSRPVVGTNGDGSIEAIIKPYLSETVEIDKYFYSKDSDEETQTKSLIYFENTYMKNTGILYKSESVFDIVAVMSGTVLNIKEDEILGNVVEVEHNPNLRTIYYSLDSINVKVGDTINQGETLGVSGSSRISEAKYNLLFEVYYNGTLMNPLEFYEMDPKTLN